MEWVSVRLKADARLTQSVTTISLGVPVSLTYIKEMGTNSRPHGGRKNGRRLLVAAASPVKATNIALLLYYLYTAEIFAQHLRHNDAAVCLLILLDKRRKDTARRKTGAVERVYILDLSRTFSAETDGTAARLIIARVRD